MSDAYLQFPLCCLAFGNGVVDRLGHILSLAVAAAGEVMDEKLTSGIKEDLVCQFSADPKTPKDFSNDNAMHVATMIGANKIGVRLMTVCGTTRQYETLKRHVANFESAYGPDALVRVPRDIILAGF